MGDVSLTHYDSDRTITIQLKDIKGNAWIVQIIDSPRSSIELNSNIYQTTINFSWQEMENVSDYSIIEVLN